MNYDSSDLEARLRREVTAREPVFAMSAHPSFAMARRVRRRRRALGLAFGGGLVTVAVVAALSLTPGAGEDRDVARDDAGVATREPAVAVSEATQRVLLDLPGWRVESPGSDGDVYRSGEASLELTRYPAATYDSYVKDREHITDPPAPGRPVEVLGQPAQLWAYSGRDHTVIREVVDGQWMELRGQGMDEATYLDVLSNVRLVSQAAFDAALPPEFVTSAESSAAITEMLDGIDSTLSRAHSAFPMGADQTLQSTEEDPYQLGAYVAGQVTCAWLTQYVEARKNGEPWAAADAAEVLATSRQWPVLLDMEREGDYPEVVWAYADDVAAGVMPQGFAAGLGC